MSKLHQVKVFRANDKRCDFTIRSVTTDAGVRKADQCIAGLGGLVDASFTALKAVGGQSLSFRHKDRKIKVELAA